VSLEREADTVRPEIPSGQSYGECRNCNTDLI
jgi:hypothetical protein